MSKHERRKAKQGLSMDQRSAATSKLRGKPSMVTLAPAGIYRRGRVVYAMCPAGDRGLQFLSLAAAVNFEQACRRLCEVLDVGASPEGIDHMFKVILFECAQEDVS